MYTGVTVSVKFSSVMSLLLGILHKVALAFRVGLL